MASFYQQRKENYTSQESINNSYPTHLHNQVELIYVTKGSLDVTIDGSTYHLSQGDMSICFPNLVHSTHTPDESNTVIIIFDVDFVCEFSNELLKSRPDSPVIEAKYITDEMVHCIEMIHGLYSTPHDYRISSSYLSILLAHMLPFLKLIKIKPSNDFDACQSILTYIDNHYTEDLSLELLANKLNISKYYISHIFSSKVKESFPVYLNQKRIKYAKHLLETTDKSIIEISYMAGFNSIRTFYRVFDYTYHISPAQFRTRLELENHL